MRLKQIRFRLAGKCAKQKRQENCYYDAHPLAHLGSPSNPIFDCAYKPYHFQTQILPEQKPHFYTQPFLLFIHFTNLSPCSEWPSRRERSQAKALLKP